MPLEAETCPSCGAPLSVVAGRCSYCDVPLLTVSAPAAPGAPAPRAEAAPEDPNAPFALTVEDVFVIKGKGTIVTGKVTSGTLRVGDAVVIAGGTKPWPATCIGIDMFRKQMESATAGNNVGLILDNLGKNKPERGNHVSKA